MTVLPAPESNRPPEGIYEVYLNREPDVEPFPYTRKDGTHHTSKKLILFVEVTGEAGTFSIVDSFLPWDQRYLDLLAALNVEHGREIRMTGMTFTADITYAADKHDASKSYPRLTKIRPSLGDDSADYPAADGDGIPF